MADNEIYLRNIQWAHPSKNYITQLSGRERKDFQKWVEENNVPYDPSPAADYDMPGYWRSIQNAELPQAKINPNDGMLHYPDYYKTPYHKSFSAESRFATEDAPVWNDQDQLVAPDGTIVYDERKKKR